MRVQQEPGPFSVVSLTRAHTKPRAGLQDRLYHKDSAYAGSSAPQDNYKTQDPRKATRSLAGTGSDPTGDEKLGLHPGGSNSEVQTRSRGIRGTKRTGQEYRREAGLADQLGDQMSHLASLPLQPQLGEGQPSNLREQA